MTSSATTRERPSESCTSAKRRTVLCLAALLIASLEGWMLNASLYSHVATYCGIAREINTFVGAALFLVLFAVAMRRPAALDNRLLTLAAFGSLVTAVIVLEVALPLESEALTIAGLAFGRIAAVWACTVTVLALWSLCSPKAIVLAVAGGLALGQALPLALPVPSFEVGVVGCTLCFGVVIALLYRPAGEGLAAVVEREAPASLELANPESFFAPTHALFMCTFLFSVASGYALTLNEVEHAPVVADIVAVVLVGVAVWLVVSRSDDKEDKLFSFSCLLVIAGFLVAPFTFFSETASANALIRIGNVSFDMLLWMVIVAVGRRNVLALLPTFALTRCMKALGTDVGAIVGHTSNDLVGTDSQTAALMAAIALFFFVAFLWIGFRRFSFADTIKGVANVGSETRDAHGLQNHAAKPTVDVADDAAGERGHADVPLRRSIEERCVDIGAQHGLTERETEIFAMLARGRNGQFIMEHYVVSRNTVKSHVKHIYAKLDVHSQQELIDLVEHAEAPRAKR